MPSYLLEIIVLVVGLILLVIEAFASPKHKGWIVIPAWDKLPIRDHSTACSAA